MRGKIFAGMAALALAFLSATPVARGGLIIQFDTSFDSGNFFGSNPQAMTLLNDAADFFQDHITDNLTAIDPAAQSITDNTTDTWTTDAFNPTDPNNSTADIKLSNLTVPANVITVYVGGTTTFPSGQLGLGGPGGIAGGSGSQAWVDILSGRGQAGALATTPTDFGPWGGSVAFNSTATWYFDPSNPEANPPTNSVPAGQNDFYSVALHELGHVLGFGTADSWNALVSGNTFTGANAEALNGSTAVALSTDLSHWAQGTTSDIFGTNTAQETDMDPSLTVGTRKYFTDLDMAGLQDVGWNVVPEPAAWPWLAALGALGAHFWRKKNFRLSRPSTV